MFSGGSRRCQSQNPARPVRPIGTGAAEQREIIVDRNATVRQLKRKIGEMYGLEHLTLAKVRVEDHFLEEIIHSVWEKIATVGGERLLHPILEPNPKITIPTTIASLS